MKTPPIVKTWRGLERFQVTNIQKSSLFTKVQDVATGIGRLKGIYDAGMTLYNVGRAAAPVIGALL